MYDLLNNITVVIRSAGERTVAACLENVKSEIPNAHIFLIEERPFSEAVKKTFEIGLRENKKWTLAVDADLILFENSILEMILNAEKYGNDLFVYQGYILDKFKMNVRQGGPHLYLTKNLEDTSRYYEEMEKNLRPESFYYDKMRGYGKKIIVERKLFALHDFCQYPIDIYRKGFYHGIKHSSWNQFSSLWKDKSETDMDYGFLLKGFKDGLVCKTRYYPSIDFLNHKFNQINHNIPHSSEIANIDKNAIKFIVKNYGIDLYKDYTFEKIYNSRRNKLKRLFQRITVNLRIYGYRLRLGF